MLWLIKVFREDFGKFGCGNKGRTQCLGSGKRVGMRGEIYVPKRVNMGE